MALFCCVVLRKQQSLQLDGDHLCCTQLTPGRRLEIQKFNLSAFVQTRDYNAWCNIQTVIIKYSWFPVYRSLNPKPLQSHSWIITVSLTITVSFLDHYSLIPGSLQSHSWIITVSSTITVSFLDHYSLIDYYSLIPGSLQSHSQTITVSFLDHYSLILRSLQSHSWIITVSFLDHYSLILMPICSQ